MTSDTDKPSVTALRARAEEALCREPSPCDSGPSDVASLLHELQVHQIKLEMQNDALKNARDAAEASAARYADLYDCAPVGYLILDRIGAITQANLAAAQLLGCERSRLLGHGLGQWVFEPSVPTFNTFLWESFFVGVQPACDLEIHVNGQTLTVQMDASLSDDGQECRLVMVDIAARKRAEAALRDSEERLKGFVDSAMDAIVSVDSLQRIAQFNSAAQAMFGYAPADVLGQPLDRLMPSRFAAGHAANVTNYGKEATTARKMGALGVLLGLRADGEEFPIEVSISRSLIDGDARFTAIIRDVSESKLAQLQLQWSRDDLRALANRLQTGREEQRAHLAREIHDVLAQELTRLKIDLSWMKRRLGATVDEPLRENLLVRAEQAMALVDSSISTVQRIATELRPVILDSLGLFAAIDWQVEDFAQRSGLQCSTSVAQDGVPPARDISIVLFRILQEGLTNIARHAHATEVSVKLEFQHDVWVLTIHDNGVGITEAQIAAHCSLGLLGMEERALAIGGSVHFAGSPSVGTTITARVPAGA